MKERLTKKAVLDRFVASALEVSAVFLPPPVDRLVRTSLDAAHAARDLARHLVKGSRK